jgi:predicted PurR-regulated permease PerM
MSNRSAKKAPVVRLPPKSNTEIILARGAQAAMIGVGFVVLIFALQAGEFILAPIFLAVVVGLMFGPIATRVERFGLPPAISAILVVLLFIGLIAAFSAALAAPLSEWVGRIPQLWTELQQQLAGWQRPLEALQAVREELRGIMGAADVKVSVEDGSAVESVATMAPGVIAQLLLFFASLYFFVATRHQIRTMVLGLSFDRRLRWRIAHIFRDVEKLVSKYLLSITLINIVEGILIGLGLFAIGVPSAALWGALAIITNFVPFIGPLVMTIVLFAVGLTEFETLGGSLLPPLVYQAINVVEAQFVTPTVIGRQMTLNPFVVLLALVFWIWMWGPIGGFIAIPALLILYAVLRNLVPGIIQAERTG